MSVLSGAAGEAATDPPSRSSAAPPIAALRDGRLVRRRSRPVVVLSVLAGAVVLAFLLAIVVGSVTIPLGTVVSILLGETPERASWAVIVHDVRLPRAVTAALSGAALGIAGLQMQTLLRNPLADPFALGITSGASLGVAIAVLGAGSAAGALLGGAFGLAGDLAVAAAAILGAFVVLVPVLVLASRVRNAATILIIGLMFGYAVQSVVTILVVGTSFEQLQRWIAWGYGSFGGVTSNQLAIYVPLLVVGIGIAAATTKQLNALLLGEAYAKSMGLNVRAMRIATLAGASTLAGVVTAFCGPIVFLGVAIPHLARGLVGTSDHRVLVPAVILLGAVLALLAQLAALVANGDGLLPLNAVTSLIGAPVVVFVILRSRKGAFVA
ncbi:MAG: iron ABC transporter permease [Bauldia sp.]|nr:iron ABC transporter permease [Bauldia sp.]